MPFINVPDGHGIIYGIVLYGTGLILLAMFIRAIASWVRIDERYAFIRFLAKFTDPFVAPFRRIIPPMGFINVSWIIAFFAIMTIQTLLLQAIPFGW